MPSQVVERIQRSPHRVCEGMGCRSEIRMNLHSAPGRFEGRGCARSRGGYPTGGGGVSLHQRAAHRVCEGVDEDRRHRVTRGGDPALASWAGERHMPRGITPTGSSRWG